jgi:hypothetical protein
MENTGEVKGAFKSITIEPFSKLIDYALTRTVLGKPPFLHYSNGCFRMFPLAAVEAAETRKLQSIRSAIPAM